MTHALRETLATIAIAGAVCATAAGASFWCLLVA